MKMRTLRNDVLAGGAVDWDRRLFDSLIPIPDGTSYNAYLIRGSRQTALLDTVDPSMTDVLAAQLAEVKRLDFVVSHHTEQDHSGAIPFVLNRYPEATVLASAKAKPMLTEHLGVSADRIRIVQDGEIVDLGGKTLEFLYTPWVHWPETMCTYLMEDRILFSCDFFGAHLATSDLTVADEGKVYEAAKRYYAEIMMPFRTVIKKNMEKVKAHPLDLIAPSHGPVYDRPAFILEAYEDWVGKVPKNEVVLPYISMHGSTEKMVKMLVSALTERNVKVHCFNMASTDIGKLAIALVDAATIVIGTPTVFMGPHPAIFFATHLANALSPKLRYASIIGSYGWNSKVIEHLSALIPNLKVEVLPTVLCRGLPGENDSRALEALADTIAARHRELK
ncbi:MAG: FprA family A-type flavoprotein [Lentisphaerae bacterium]|nr:FprA family A-type flavoprotein [Lentisphaerota bacterium]